ncbi:MAG: 16S rRNA (guanine(966)-N(2))-methyltransferase RsmD [Acetobacteraceae bacterium]|nr:16S rRNA (guanine(966)-N(2))-methyltransferase RsmD [Acetobacteraceae bacterium]
MRVIGGVARGRRLLSPRGPAGRGAWARGAAPGRARPTLDRVRVTLFDILAQPLARPPLEGSSFLDLYAGTGAVGIEALSRGAARVVMVESDPALCRLIAQNLSRTGLRGPGAEVRCLSADRALAALGRRREHFHLVFLDPPYEAGLVEETLKMVDGWGVVAPGGTAIAQHSSREEPADRVGGLQRFLRRSLGDTVLSFYRGAGAPPSAGGGPQQGGGGGA